MKRLLDISLYYRDTVEVEHHIDNSLRSGLSRAYDYIFAHIYIIFCLAIQPVIARAIIRRIFRPRKSVGFVRNRNVVIYVTDRDLYYGDLFKYQEINKVCICGGFRIRLGSGLVMYEALISARTILKAYFQIGKGAIRELNEKKMVFNRSQYRYVSNLRIFARSLVSHEMIQAQLLHLLGLSLSHNSYHSSILFPMEGRRWERAFCSGSRGKIKVVGYIPTFLTDRNEGFFTNRMSSFPDSYPETFIVPGRYNYELLDYLGFGSRLSQGTYLKTINKSSVNSRVQKRFDILLALSGDIEYDMRLIQLCQDALNDLPLRVKYRSNPRVPFSKEIGCLLKGYGWDKADPDSGFKILLSCSIPYCLEAYCAGQKTIGLVLGLLDNEYPQRSHALPIHLIPFKTICSSEDSSMVDMIRRFVLDNNGTDGCKDVLGQVDRDVISEVFLSNNIFSDGLDEFLAFRSCDKS